VSHTFSHLCFHCIFSTKDRRPSIPDELRNRLHRYIRGVLRNIHASPAPQPRSLDPSTPSYVPSSLSSDLPPFRRFAVSPFRRFGVSAFLDPLPAPARQKRRTHPLPGPYVRYMFRTCPTPPPSVPERAGPADPRLPCPQVSVFRRFGVSLRPFVPTSLVVARCLDAWSPCRVFSSNRTQKTALALSKTAI